MALNEDRRATEARAGQACLVFSLPDALHPCACIPSLGRSRPETMHSSPTAAPHPDVGKVDLQWN